MVRIYPVPGVTLHPWPPIEQEVTVKEWAALQKYSPQPFTDKPGKQPATPAEPSAEDGSSDIEGDS